MVSLSNPVPLVTAIVAIVPAGVLFFFAYGRYDGLFKDQTVFLFFIGGLLAGSVLSLFAVLMAVEEPLALLTLVPILYAIGATMALNRRKWRNERHSVFNGGALGLGIAAMTAFAFIFRDLSDPERGLSWALATTWLVLAFALAALLLGTGLVLGAGVAERHPFRATFLAAALTAVEFFLLYEYVRSRALLWPALALLFGLVVFGLAYSRVMPRGVEPGSRRALKRRRAPT